MTRIDVDTAIFNPASVFKSPEEILKDEKVVLTREQKIRALQTWSLDIKLRRVAEEENMTSKHDQVDVDLEIEIFKALNHLNAEKLVKQQENESSSNTSAPKLRKP